MFILLLVVFIIIIFNYFYLKMLRLRDGKRNLLESRGKE